MAELAATALLLDLDGTLWDSADWYPKLIAEACGQGGPEIEAALQRKAVARVLGDFGVTQARFAELCGDLGSSLVVFDGVADVLARIAARGIATGAVTNLPGWIATPMLRATGLAPLLDVVIPYSRTVRL
jgi:phosphoglycolate phosphatase-like HAD superfamily hydrolase